MYRGLGVWVVRALLVCGLVHAVACRLLARPGKRRGGLGGMWARLLPCRPAAPPALPRRLPDVEFTYWWVGEAGLQGGTRTAVRWPCHWDLCLYSLCFI